MNHNDHLTPQIIDRLKSHYQFKERGDHLREGVCPDCDKKSLWTWKAKPGMVQCNRVSKCGFSETSKSLFPDLFADLDKKYPQTKANPTATADAYLSLVRGFDLDLLHGSYSQESYNHPHGNRASTSVRFYLSLKDGVYWERLIDDVTITHADGDKEVRNKNFKGSFKGLWWSPPGQKIEEKDTVYLTEGIFDAIALWQNGLKACAIMSAGSLPKETIERHFNKKITWILALDNDKAGRLYTHKHIKWLKQNEQKASAMFSSDGTGKCDWNDLHQRDQLEQSHIHRYRYFGKLELVVSPANKAQLMFEFGSGKQTFFTFSHHKRMYRCTVDKDGYEKAQMELTEAAKNTDEINDGAFFTASKTINEGNCNIELLHILEGENGEDPFYSVNVEYDNGAPSRQIDLSGKSFSSPSDFKKSVMSKAPGALCTATAKSLDHRFTQWFIKKPITVKSLDYAGYHIETRAYIYKEWAVQEGKIMKVNKDKFFELKQGGMRSQVDLKQKLVDSHPKPWFTDYKTAYGEGGLVALCWWVGCLYVEQIRKDYRSYPFIEIVGEAGSGKTDMVDFLWKLYGREDESFNPNSSTLAGRTRKMAEVSNFPVVFNEVDNETAADNNHGKRFNWDEQKDLFDGEFGRVTGVKTQDNNTKKPRFKAGLCIVQNIPVFASEAILSRIIHLQFDRAHHTQAGKLASDRLNRLALTDVSGFLLQATSQAKAVMSRFEQRLAVHIERLQNNGNITLQRIIENHAKIMALADCLELLMPISDADIDTIYRVATDMAETRQQALREDAPRVVLFWENFNYLNTRFQTSNDGDLHTEHAINHHKNPEDFIAVSLREYFQLAKDRNLDQIPTAELHKILPSSFEYEYISGSTVVKSVHTNKNIRCWLFKTPEKKARDLREAAEKKGRGK